MHDLTKMPTVPLTCVSTTASSRNCNRTSARRAPNRFAHPNFLGPLWLNFSSRALVSAGSRPELLRFAQIYLRSTSMLHFQVEGHVHMVADLDERDALIH